MGKRADTETLAGTERAGPESVPELKLVTPTKRQLILEGMLEAVGSEGYEQTSVRTVLDRTGVYRQAFYDNFADKDDCFLQAYELGLERLGGLLVEAAAEETTWTGQLRAGLDALLRFLEAEPEVGRALFVEVHAAGAQALAQRTAALEQVNAFLDRAREATDGAESPPAVASEGVSAGIHAVIHSRLATAPGDGFRQLLPEFVYFAVLPYFGAERASEEMQAATP